MQTAMRSVGQQIWRQRAGGLSLTDLAAGLKQWSNTGGLVQGAENYWNTVGEFVV